VLALGCLHQDSGLQYILIGVEFEQVAQLVNLGRTSNGVVNTTILRFTIGLSERVLFWHT